MLPEELKLLAALVKDYERLCDWYCLHPEKYPERYAVYFEAKNLVERLREQQEYLADAIKRMDKEDMGIMTQIRAEQHATWKEAADTIESLRAELARAKQCMAEADAETERQIAALKDELKEINATINMPECDLTLTAAECIRKLKAQQGEPVGDIHINPDDRGNPNKWGNLYDTCPDSGFLYTAPPNTEALRKDAERYRELRNGVSHKLHVRGEWNGYLGDYCHLHGDKLDAAIDAAMKGE